MKREAISNIREREKGKHISKSTQNNTKFEKFYLVFHKKKKQWWITLKMMSCLLKRVIKKNTPNINESLK